MAALRMYYASSVLEGNELNVHAASQIFQQLSLNWRLIDIIGGKNVIILAFGSAGGSRYG